ncbi:hypothetical protein E3E31_08505 [Thermococcus sp. M39]|uniref:hypothetical protein n=1 Tax=Thermococcus sp. M39 TaxID=1638262 RepID=UPI00143AAA57|nr:hypothetical protein [Thermococcus sp. M39]NJE08560.1 hypothetical protein [Thermococcus sp. M39]
MGKKSWFGIGFSVGVGFAIGVDPEITLIDALIRIARSMYTNWPVVGIILLTILLLHKIKKESEPIVIWIEASRQKGETSIAFVLGFFAGLAITTIPIVTVIILFIAEYIE